MVLDGGEILTFKNSGSDVTGAAIGYSIAGGSFTEKSLAFNQDNVGGTGGDQRWYSDSTANVNMLAGLPNGTYTLSVYLKDNNTDRGSDYVNNTVGGTPSNYNATFKVVPEPSSALMLLAGSSVGAAHSICCAASEPDRSDLSNNLSFLVPKLHLGTHLLRKLCFPSLRIWQLVCRDLASAGRNERPLKSIGEASSRRSPIADSRDCGPST